MPWRASLLALFLVFAALVPARAGDVSHVIRPGDTPAALAQRYRVSVAALLARNPGLDPRRLRVGAVVTVPGEPAVAPPVCAVVLPDEEALGTRHVVAPGDTPAAPAPVTVSRPGQPGQAAPLIMDFR